MNYIQLSDLPEVFRRLHLFIRPGGLLLFDILSPEHLRSLDGRVSVDEKSDLLCLWRSDFDAKQNALTYGVDIFSSDANCGGVIRKNTRNTLTNLPNCFSFLKKPVSPVLKCVPTVRRVTADVYLLYLKDLTYCFIIKKEITQWTTPLLTNLQKKSMTLR